MKPSICLHAATISAVVLACGAWSPRAGALPVCPAQWYVSYSGTGSFVLLNTDPDNLPLSALRFSRTYNDPTDLSHGYLDFNRDGKSDVFSAVPIGGGAYQWRYMSGGKGSWINLAYDGTSPDDLRFGDFNGDGYTDVFSVIYDNSLGAYQWRYSSGGMASYKELAYAGYTIDQLRFGDFNGDGKTDVFALEYLGAGSYAWLASLSVAPHDGQPGQDGGSTSFTQINIQPTLLADLEFGDFDGNGHTDVFTTVVNPEGADMTGSTRRTAAGHT
jgi:hypothetical protein